MSPPRWEQPTVYLQSGDPENENVPSLAYPGQLGIRFTQTNPQRSAPAATAGRSKRYQLIRTDSSMAVAPFPGATAYWGDKTQYVVTTNSPSVAAGRNRVAGKFSNAITPGNYGCVQFEGPGIVKLIDAAVQGDVVIGAWVIPSSTNAKATVVAAATAPINTPFGIVSSPLSYNVASQEVMVDLNVPETT